MLCLNIRATQAMIGTVNQAGSFSMRSPRPQLSVDHEWGGAGIWPSKPRLDMDSTASRASYGLKSVGAAIAEAAQKGRQDILEGMRRNVREGNQMADNGAKYNVVAQIARSKIRKPDEMIVEVTQVPDVKITVTPGQMQGQNNTGSLSMKYDLFPVEANFQPGSAKTYVKQPATIRMWTSEGKYDIYA